MKDDLYTRFRNRTHVKCVFSCKKGNKCYFLITGSTGTKYKVTAEPSGEMTCSCPDFAHRKLFCKHIMAVVVDTCELVTDCADSCFDNNKLTTIQWSKMLKVVK